jgi:hypothetical protein
MQTYVFITACLQIFKILGYNKLELRVNISKLIEIFSFKPIQIKIIAETRRNFHRI